MVTVATLVAAGINPSQARLFAAPLQATCERFEINTKMRVAHFVAQCGHESLGFSHLEESMWYSRPEIIRQMWPTRIINMAMAQSLVGKPEELANTVYSNRDGNGDKLSGDGWTFIGRGLIGLTFRGNYARCSVAMDRPYEQFPEMVATPEHACLTAGWYWHENHINAAADTGSVESVTKKINPKMVGLDDRKRRTAQALGAFA
jgi:putative chitinase